MVAAFFLIKPDRAPIPVSIPVDIVNLPQELAKKLPPMRQPLPPPARTPSPTAPQQRRPEKPVPRDSVPKPKQFGTDDNVLLPKTSPQPGAPEGAEQGKETGKPEPKEMPKPTGPLPFLTQNDIDQLARKGMPQKKPGDDSVTLDTDEFKFISYNRWLKIKVESVLKYPELAAISGYQGSLYIQFDIMKDGSLGAFQVLKSSGYKILDDEAERSIRSSAPFQPLPPEWNMDRYSIRAAVMFYLGTGYIR
jgi:protein TonB